MISKLRTADLPEISSNCQKSIIAFLPREALCKCNKYHVENYVDQFFSCQERFLYVL